MKDLVKSLFAIDLQLFGDDDLIPGTVEDEIVDDGGTDDDNLDDDGVEDDDAGDEGDEDLFEDGDDDDSDGGEDDGDKPETGKVKFDKAQQAKVNELIKARLDRAEARWMQNIQDAAGIDLDVSNGGGEVLEAAKLWGFLKANPGISDAVQSVLDQFVNAGAYKEPSRGTTTAEQRLEVKEAVIDLKDSDKTFAKNHKQILEWAEQEGFEINSKKALNQAYLAWKGANMKKELANTQLKEQRKSQQKQGVRNRAVLQSGKGKSSGKLDYTKMSDRDILASMGVSLFKDNE